MYILDNGLLQDVCFKLSELTGMNIEQPNNAYLSLGSNSKESAAKIREAVQAISALSGIRILAQSPVFITEPQEVKNQDWFHNLCIKVLVDNKITAEELLAELLKLETLLGRKRDNGIRFGPRTIDIDLLLFGNRQSSEPFLQLPHPRMHKRAFVLLPLHIIEPGLTLYGNKIIYWLSRLNWKLDKNKILQN